MKTENLVIGVNNYEDFIRQASKLIGTMKSGKLAAIMYTDVTGFQLVNDFYGFTEGDRFLQALGDFIKMFPNTAVSGRVFSDHFLRLAIIDEETDIQQITVDYKERIDEFLEEQYQYHMNCRLNLCCGYCVVENGVQGLVKAIDDANLARKEVKGCTHTSINWFDNAIRQRIKERKDMEISIQSALREEEFIFYLQPKVNLNTGKVVGTEALARWVRADGSMVYPDAFIPLMESNGTIMELDFLIYRKVCRYLREKILNGRKTVPISVNISRAHIYQRDFVENIHEVAVEYGIPPYLLEFELTENILLERFDQAKEVMDALRAYGYKVSIDDFGSGFTGVNIWQKLDFDVLKLDKTFISKNTEEMKRNDTIITSITYVGKKRQTELLCEGTETKEQCRHMKELGCETAQGYYFSRPVSVEVFEKVMQENNGYYSVFWAENAEKIVGLQSVEEWERLQLDNFYREIYDLVDCAIIQYREAEAGKKNYNCISLNRYAMELYGFSNKEEALQEDVDIINDFVLQEDMECYADKVKRLNHPGDSAVLDFRIRRRDGKTRYITGTLKIMLDQNGDKMFLGVLVDKSKQQELDILKGRMNMVMENTPGDIVILTVGKDSLHTQYLTTGLARVFGYTKEEFETIVNENSGMRLIYKEDRRKLFGELYRTAEQRESINLNFRATYRSGKLGWHNLTAALACVTVDGEAVYHGIVTDITRLKMQEEALEESARHYRAAAIILKADIWSYNFKKNQMELPVAEELSDLNLGGNTKISLENFVQGGHIHPDYTEHYKQMYKKIWEGEETSEVELLAKTRDGKYQWFRIKCQALSFEGGRPLEMVGVAENIHQRKINMQRYRKLKEKTMLDKLTGICNRSAAIELMQMRLNSLDEETEHCAFFLLDIDDFKTINDNFGHQMGDLVLQTLCSTLKQNLPADSVLGRLGGDEFILLTPELSNGETAAQVAEMICCTVSSIFRERDEFQNITVSVGIAFAEKRMKFEELYKRADAAMYHIKNTGKNGYHIWGTE